MDLDSLRAVNGKLLQNIDSLKHDNDANKKKWVTREKQLRAKEAALTAREANQCEKDEQIELLKAHVNTLELNIVDLEGQNKLFKLKLLASEDVRNSNHASSNDTSHQTLTTNINSVLQTSLLALTTILLSNAQPPPHQPQHRITNISQPYGHGCRKPQTGGYRNRKHPSQVYNHQSQATSTNTATQTAFQQTPQTTNPTSSQCNSTPASRSCGGSTITAGTPQKSLQGRKANAKGSLPTVY